MACSSQRARKRLRRTKITRAIINNKRVPLLLLKVPTSVAEALGSDGFPGERVLELNDYQQRR